MEIKKKTLYKALGILILALAIILIIVLSGGNAPESGFAVFDNSSLFPSLGPENTNIPTVIEFSDFQCPWCAVASGLPEWAKENAKTNPNVASVLGASETAKEFAKEGKIRFIYVSMSFLGKESSNAAEAALCANEQGKFWEMHDAIFTSDPGPEENDGTFTKENLELLAENISSLNQAEFNSCLKSSRMLPLVQQIADIAKDFTSSTPSFFVNEKQVSVSELENELNSLIN